MIKTESKCSPYKNTVFRLRSQKSVPATAVLFVVFLTSDCPILYYLKHLKIFYKNRQSNISCFEINFFRTNYYSECGKYWPGNAGWTNNWFDPRLNSYLLLISSLLFTRYSLLFTRYTLRLSLLFRCSLLFVDVQCWCFWWWSIKWYSVIM